jgi:hypothetical protein
MAAAPMKKATWAGLCSQAAEVIHVPGSRANGYGPGAQEEQAFEDGVIHTCSSPPANR